MLSLFAWNFSLDIHDLEDTELSLKSSFRNRTI